MCARVRVRVSPEIRRLQLGMRTVNVYGIFWILGNDKTETSRVVRCAFSKELAGIAPVARGSPCLCCPATDFRTACFLTWCCHQRAVNKMGGLGKLLAGLSAVGQSAPTTRFLFLGTLDPSGGKALGLESCLLAGGQVGRWWGRKKLVSDNIVFCLHFHGVQYSEPATTSLPQTRSQHGCRLVSTSLAEIDDFASLVYDVENRQGCFVRVLEKSGQPNTVPTMLLSIVSRQNDRI